MSRPAFITGSREYGTPRDDSDLDVVVMVDTGTYNRISDFSKEYNSAGGYAVRFGRLNLILCDNPAKYDAFRRATNELKEMAPVDRETAVSVCKRHLGVK